MSALIIRIPAAVVAADVVDEYIRDYRAGELCLPMVTTEDD